ncbi:MAG: Asp23/Gls24 family envelope stress response protein [Gudongella sp.]|nr:Asp23/Gls24 family envelope stress response protein [Gudongella sp.]
MAENVKNEYIENGVINISNDVISTIASTAAMEVEGVVGMNNNLAGGISELLGKKNHGKGVKTEVTGNEVSLELHLNLSYGAKLNQVGEEVQIRVKEAIENMTDLLVKNVEVHIEGVVRTKSEEDKAK